MTFVVRKHTYLYTAGIHRMLHIIRLLHYTTAINLIRVTGCRHILDLSELRWPLYASTNTPTAIFSVVSNNVFVVQNRMFIYLSPIRCALDSIYDRQGLPDKENHTLVLSSMGAEVEYGRPLGGEFTSFVVDRLRGPL